MKIKLFTLAALMLTFFSSCSTQSQKGKILVLYYSQTGTTQKVAEEICRQTGADIARIEALEPYGEDYQATIERWRKEKEEGVKVEIEPLTVNLEEYETIFLGFPIWGGTVASPMATFLSDYSLAGKKVVTFATFGSGGIKSATEDVRKVQPEAQIVEGYGVRNARIEKSVPEIERFLIEGGYVNGSVMPLPAYGETREVTEEDCLIFEKACSNYQFPLGTPVRVSQRVYEGTEEYRFEVKGQRPDGQETESTIYIVVAPGTEPEFTQVVR